MTVAMRKAKMRQTAHQVGELRMPVITAPAMNAYMTTMAIQSFRVQFSSIIIFEGICHLPKCCLTTLLSFRSHKIGPLLPLDPHCEYNHRDGEEEDDDHCDSQTRNCL